MNYNSESSHVFYIILIILCALIILNIVERQLLVKMENKSEKKKINILYYETIFRNIKLGKIVLFILLFTVFLILINPFKLFSIFNINIFSIIGERYSHLKFNLDNQGEIYDVFKDLIRNNKEHKYIGSNKPYLNLLDKTLKEIIMNKKTSSIITRILNEMGGQTEENKKILFNLIQSINLENQLNNVDYNTFKKFLNNKEDFKGEEWAKLYKKLQGEENNLLLDTSEYKKFTTFNSLIKGDLLIPSKLKYDNHLHLIIFLGIYYLYELIYEIHTFFVVDKKQINTDVEILAAGNNEFVNTTTILFNLIIFIIILRIQNNKNWLVQSELITVDTNKYLPMLLFVINCSCKIYFKFNSFLRYDSFLLMKLMLFISNLLMVLLISNYFYKSKITPIIGDKKIYKIIGINKTDEKKFRYIITVFDEIFINDSYNFMKFFVYGSLFSIFNSLYSININYYDRKKAQYTDNSQEKELEHKSMGFIHSGLNSWINLILIIIYNWITFSKYFSCSWDKNANKGPGTKFLESVEEAGAYLSPDTSNLKDKEIMESSFGMSKTQTVIWIVTIILFIAHIVLFKYVPDYTNFIKSIFPFLGSHNVYDDALEGGDGKNVLTIMFSILTFITVSHNLFLWKYGTLDLPGYKNYQNIWIQNIISLIVVNISFVYIMQIKNTIVKNILYIVLFLCIIFIQMWFRTKTQINYCNNENIIINNDENITFTKKEIKGGNLLKNITNNENKLEKIVKYILICLVGILLYRLYKNYNKKKTNKKIKGGEIDPMEDELYDIKPTQLVDNQIIMISISIIILLLLYVNGLLKTSDLGKFIENELLSSANLNILKLMFFPFIIITIISLVGGSKFLKTLVIREIEKQTIGNFNSSLGMDTREKLIIRKYSNQFVDKKAAEKKLYEKKIFRIAKYSFLGFIIVWYLGLLYYGRVSISPVLALNILLISIYVYLAINVVYIFYKIYMNENVNNISQEIDKITDVKKNIKFNKGKINPEILDEVIEINTEETKEKYEQFIFEIYKNLYDILSINNVYLTNHIANYIKMKLVTYKKLEEEFSLVNSPEAKKLTQNPIKLDVNGKWVNKKDKNNIILYIYNNKFGVVIYLNETSYNNMKVVEVIFKDSTYEFISDNQLLFTYTNEIITINGVEYNRLSNEFSTDNIIKKTIADNDVFKNLNYMISIDKDSKYIGKYNLIEDLTKYNLYKKKGDPLSIELEEIILNKILLIKAIRDKKYKEAQTYSSKLNELESKFRRKMDFYKFDSNRDGTIDINEIDNYVSKNYKLSDPGNVKIKTVMFDGVNLIVRFDKKITSDNTFKSLSGTTVTDIDLISDLFELKINGEQFNNGEQSNTGNFILPYENEFEGSGIFNFTNQNYYFKINSNNYFNEDIHYIEIISKSEGKVDSNVNSLSANARTGKNLKNYNNEILQNNLFQLIPDNTKINTFAIIKNSGSGSTYRYTYPDTPPFTNSVFKNYDKIKFKIVDNEGDPLSKTKVNKNNTNIEIVNNDTLKIKLTEKAIHTLNTSNDIKLRIKNPYDIIISEDIIITAATASTNLFTLEDSASVIEDDQIYYPYDEVNGLKDGDWAKDSYYKVKVNAATPGKIQLKTGAGTVKGFTSTKAEPPIILKKIKMTRKLKKAEKKIHKTINNFEEFDNSIFGT
tara:strand:- start:822 stop:5783 length:4962 start_codon:yes stop_codon:yes gene_type:complete